MIPGLSGMKPLTDSEDDARSKRGRPPGEVTPESLLKSELIAHLKLYKRLRETVERRLQDPALDAEDLTKYMDLIRKGIADMVKPFVAVAKPESARPQEEPEDAESILRKLIAGGA